MSKRKITDNEVPSTSKKIVNENNEIVNLNQQKFEQKSKKIRLESSGIFKQNDNENNEIENASQQEYEGKSKKISLEYNFWSDTGEEIETTKEIADIIKIRNLHIGKFESKKLLFRVTYVSNIRTTRIGEVINFHGMDDSGEISFVMFGESCRLIFNFLEINSVYYVLNFSVNEENIQYPSGSGNRFQIKLDSNSEIEELDELDCVPIIYFKFISLGAVQNINKNERIDVIGVLVKDFGLDKNYRGVAMRELSITDVTKSMLSITLWSKNAENFSVDKFSVLVIRKAVVTEYEGIKKLNCVSGTLLWVNADIPEALELKTEFNDLIKTKPNTQTK